MKQIFKRLYLLLPILLFLSISCGGSNNPAAPAASIITINPSSFDLATGSSLPVTYRSEYFTIVVYKDTTKTETMSDIEITIDFVFASPAERYYVQFYNGGERVQSPLTVKTDKYGTYVLRVDFQSGGGAAYEGQIQARSGAAFVSADFSVSAGD